MFNYIHNTPCRRLFSLAWYDDITYKVDKATGLSKALPQSCCNGSSCQSAEPEVLQKNPFINIIPTKHTETDREQIFYHTAALKTWKKETSKHLWQKERIEKSMPHSLIMLDNCLFAIAKSADL